MKASRLILFFGVLFFIGCVTPNKMKNKADLDKLIVSNLEKELISGDTIIFESFPLWCAHTTVFHRLRNFEPIENDSDFMKEVEKQFLQKIYFSNKFFDSSIDSSYLYFKYKGGLRRRTDFNQVQINGYVYSRKKIRVTEIYKGKGDSTTRRFNKIYRYKKGVWQILLGGEIIKKEYSQ